MRRHKKPNNGKTDELAEKTAAAQLEKLNLEIEQIKNKSKWHDRIAPYISLLSVIITVSGFVFAIIQFQNQQNKNRSEQEKQRSEEIQKRYENSLDKLIHFTKDEKIPVAEVLNLLYNLKTQIKEKASVKQNGEEPTPEQIAEKENQILSDVSYILVALIIKDCDLNNSRDINFANSVINEWSDFESFLNATPENAEMVIYQHQKALKKLYETDKSIISKVSFDKNENLFNHPNGYGKIDSVKITDLHMLIHNYQFLYNRLNDEKRKERTILNFQSVTCNQELTLQIMEKSFDPKSKNELKHCTEE